MMYPKLAEAVAEYRAAVNFLRHDNSATHLHQQAVDIVTKTGHVFYEVDCHCVRCGNEYTQMFPAVVHRIVEGRLRQAPWDLWAMQRQYAPGVI